jgi:hypothetical protein
VGSLDASRSGCCLVKEVETKGWSLEVLVGEVKTCWRSVGWVAAPRSVITVIGSPMI